MDTDSFIIYIKRRHLHRHCKKSDKMKFYTSNHELERPLLTGKVENSYWCNER